VVDPGHRRDWARDTDLLDHDHRVQRGGVTHALNQRPRQTLGCDTSDVMGSVLGWPSSTRSAPPIPLAPDFGVTPGQLNRWTLNQRWKVRMLAGWERH
jgi:hypothetical protein